jgi:hypothetical protein
MRQKHLNNSFKIISDRYRNRRKRFGLRFNLIAAISITSSLPAKRPVVYTSKTTIVPEL